MTNVYDIIRAAALVLGLGFSARQGRKGWIWSDSMLWGSYGLALFAFPGSLFPGNDSPLLMYMTRMFASLMLSAAASWYMSRNTRDENVIGAFLWARLVGSLLFVAVTMYFLLNSGDKFTDKTMYFEMVGFGMLLCTTVYQMWRGEYRVGGREAKGNISMLCRVMFLVIFIGGLLELAFPSFCFSFKKLEFMESLCVRLTGCMSIGCSLVWMLATSFRYDEDRISLFFASLVMLAGALISVNLGYFVDEIFTPREALMMHAGFLPWLVVIVGLYVKLMRENGNKSDYNLRSKSQ
ncbi:hypothetical protein ACF0H5_017447 [Mactra antiquata]